MSSIQPDHDVTEDDHHHDEEMPRLRLTRRMVVLGVVFVVLALAFLYFFLPQLAGLEDTWRRIETGDPWWLALAFAFTLLSFGGYVALFKYVYVRAGSRLDLRSSYQITMASLAATRLFAAGGAGGLALTAWALRRSGMRARQVADSTIVFLCLTYIPYAGALVLVGVSLYLGLLSGPAPFAMTMVPAIFGVVCFVIYGAVALIPPDTERRAREWARRGHHDSWLARLTTRVATAPATVSSGARESLVHLRDRNPSLVGSLAYWGFNVAVLWASFRAFGHAPAWGVIIMAYFVGMLGNLLPLPGGVGGVDGGMIGSFVAFGVDFGLATVAVLTYRGFAFWLPTFPGIVAYVQLRKTVRRWRAERIENQPVPVLH